MGPWPRRHDWIETNSEVIQYNVDDLLDKHIYNIDIVYYDIILEKATRDIFLNILKIENEEKWWNWKCDISQ